MTELFTFYRAATPYISSVPNASGMRAFAHTEEKVVLEQINQAGSGLDFIVMQAKELSPIEIKQLVEPNSQSKDKYVVIANNASTHYFAQIPPSLKARIRQSTKAYARASETFKVYMVTQEANAEIVGKRPNIGIVETPGGIKTRAPFYIRQVSDAYPVLTIQEPNETIPYTRRMARPDSPRMGRKVTKKTRDNSRTPKLF